MTPGPTLTITTTVMTADNFTGRGSLLIHGRLYLDNFNRAAGVRGSASPPAGIYTAGIFIQVFAVKSDAVRLVCGQCGGLWSDLESHLVVEHGMEDTCVT